MPNGVGNIGIAPQTASGNQWGWGSTAPQATGSNPMATAAQGMPTGGGGWGSFLGGAANLWGTQNASQAAQEGNNAAIGTFQPQQTIGMGAMSTLGNTLGTSGGPANYNNFLNMPGYQFAVQQGTQAIDRQATAMGNAYTPNTLAAVGQYVTGTAMQDYNTYINQLLSTSQFGQNANANIGQLQSNIGQNRAGQYAGIGGFLGGPNGSAFMNNAGGLIGKGLGYLGNYFGGGGGNGSVNPGFDTTGGSTIDPNATGDMSGGYTPSDYGAVDPNAGAGPG